VSNPFSSRRGIMLPPPAPAKLEPVEYAAPVGRPVRLVNGLCLAVVGCLVVVAVAIIVGQGGALRQAWPPILGAVFAAALMLPIMLYSRVHGYRLTQDELLVLRRNRQNRFALDGLRSVDVDPKAMAWSIKVFGNDGLGAVTGRFRNRKLGAYRAFVTDRAHAVVLRWPDRCIVVSPDRPEEFAVEVRRRAGLGR
jgi:hypothetical protein